MTKQEYGKHLIKMIESHIEDYYAMSVDKSRSEEDRAHANSVKTGFDMAVEIIDCEMLPELE